MKHLKNPSMDIKKFNGSPLEYFRFCRCSHLDASVGYNQALRDMHDHYGDVEIVVNAYVENKT